MADPDEAAVAAEMRADLIGLVGPMPSGPGSIGLDMARSITQSAVAWISPVLLTESTTAETIAADIAATGVRAVQLVRHVPPQTHHKLAERLPWVRRIQVIHVEDTGALDMIAMYQNDIDAFLLDSGRPSRVEFGGTGRVHDWTVSAEFARRTDVPVFLAGGLNPDNVAEAIATVRPFGIDVCSGVRSDGRLDREKLTAFMTASGAVQ